MVSPNNTQNKVKTFTPKNETLLEIMNVLKDWKVLNLIDENEKLVLEANGLYMPGMEEEATEEAWADHQKFYPDSTLTKGEWINVGKNAASTMSPDDRIMVWYGLETAGLEDTEWQEKALKPWKEGYAKAVKDGVIQPDLDFDKWLTIMKNSGRSASQSSGFQMERNIPEGVPRAPSRFDVMEQYGLDPNRDFTPDSYGARLWGGEEGTQEEYLDFMRSLTADEEGIIPFDETRARTYGGGRYGGIGTGGFYSEQEGGPDIFHTRPGSGYDLVSIRTQLENNPNLLARDISELGIGNIPRDEAIQEIIDTKYTREIESPAYSTMPSPESIFRRETDPYPWILAQNYDQLRQNYIEGSLPRDQIALSLWAKENNNVDLKRMGAENILAEWNRQIKPEDVYSSLYTDAQYQRVRGDEEVYNPPIQDFSGAIYNVPNAPLAPTGQTTVPAVATASAATGGGVGPFGANTAQDAQNAFRRYVTESQSQGLGYPVSTSASTPIPFFPTAYQSVPPPGTPMGGTLPGNTGSFTPSAQGQPLVNIQPNNVNVATQGSGVIPSISPVANIGTGTIGQSQTPQGMTIPQGVGVRGPMTMADRLRNLESQQRAGREDIFQRFGDVQQFQRFLNPRARQVLANRFSTLSAQYTFAAAPMEAGCLAGWSTGDEQTPTSFRDFLYGQGPTYAGGTYTPPQAGATGPFTGGGQIGTSPWTRQDWNTRIGQLFGQAQTMPGQAGPFVMPEPNTDRANYLANMGMDEAFDVIRGTSMAGLNPIMSRYMPGALARQASVFQEANPLAGGAEMLRAFANRGFV